MSLYLQALIDRQLGLHQIFYYDTILQRLSVSRYDSYFGVSPNETRLDYNPYPPLFACRFAETKGYEHILALANEDGRVAIQDTFIPHKDDIEHAAFSGQQCHLNAVFDLAWTPGSLSFVTVSGDHSAKLWDINEGIIKQVRDFQGHAKSVRTAAFRPDDSSVFATGARDGKILVWDTRAASNVSLISKPDNTIHNSHPCIVPKTPGSNSKKNARIADRTNSVTGLVFRDDYNLISCGSGDGSIRVWDLRRNYSNYKKDPLPKHSISYCGSSNKNGYSSLILDKSRIKLYASCVDNVIYCFNVSAYGVLPEQRYLGHENGSFYIKSSLSPDSNYLISGSSNHNAYIWNTKYCEPIVKLVGHNAEVTCATWCQTGDIKIITCSDDSRHKIWRIGKESLNDTEILELCGRAHEVIPIIDRSVKSNLESLERTPQAIKRKAMDNLNSTVRKRMYLQDSVDVGENSGSHSVIRKSKRSLLVMMNNSTGDSDESNPKRLNSEKNESTSECILNSPSTSKGGFSSLGAIGFSRILDHSILSDNDDGFKTPVKSPVSVVKSPCQYYLGPSEILSSPTMNLPNFVIDGKAPHLRLNSPQHKKGCLDWLTKIAKEKHKSTPKSASKNISLLKHSDDNSKPPERAKQGKTLLHFFTSLNPPKPITENSKQDNPLEDKTNKPSFIAKRKSTEEHETIEPKRRLTDATDQSELNASSSKDYESSTGKNKKKKTILSFYSAANDVENKKSS